MTLRYDNHLEIVERIVFKVLSERFHISRNGFNINCIKKKDTEKIIVFHIKVITNNIPL